MSAGNFLRSRYESDAGNIHPIRVQPENIAANINSANAAPTGDIDVAISARVSGGSRQLGLTARKIRHAFTATPPTGYAADSIVTIPILTRAVFNAISTTDPGTYLGVAVEVVGKTSESSK